MNEQKRPKPMVTAKPRKERVKPEAVYAEMMEKYPKTIAYLAK